MATTTYGAFGQVIASSGTAFNPLGFAGAFTDAESGYLYLDHRYYDSSTGQFLSSDLLVSITGQPYSYAGGDPVNSTDPSGLLTLGFCGDASFQGGPIGASANACLTRTIDRSGEDDIGLVTTGGLTGGAGADLGVGGAIQISNATNLHQLKGVFAYATVSVGAGVQGTMTVFWNASRTIWGVEIGAAVGGGIKGGGGFSDTGVIQFNNPILANIARGIWDALGGIGSVALDQWLGRAHAFVAGNC